ncbi:hypothetical protein GLOIN_2v1708728 [Rhizophagus clarus]|uniref:Uncharacterized protein n=1 Tax=Rhizophagus clarus TaxID=94130 RepID=A0A8H3LTF8_9GLOM|nr:hypothetical protein GLOIN_2v1708728 [Rhizophagus clarus]
MKTLLDSNKAMHCKYILSILHASLYIVKRIIQKDLTLTPQFEIVGEKSSGQIDYVIKALKALQRRSFIKWSYCRHIFIFAHITSYIPILDVSEVSPSEHEVLNSAS